MITPTEGQGPNVSEHVPDGGLRNGKPLITKRNRSLITEIPTRNEPIGGGRACSRQLFPGTSNHSESAMAAGLAYFGREAPCGRPSQFSRSRRGLMR